LILPRASSCCASYDSYDVRLVKLAMALLCIRQQSKTVGSTI